ncbi:MAG: hypothetical protein ACRDJW_22160 [Thermomicrobiales bacterium]
MNFRYKALGLVAALGLAVTTVGPATAQDVLIDTANVSVTLNETGQFAVSIRSDVSLPARNTSAVSGETTTSGNIRIDYVDTKSYRTLSFFTRLEADDFESQELTVPIFGGAYTIPASNLVILENHNPVQGRWSGAHPDANPDGDRIGDIGATGHGDYNLPGCLPSGTNFGPGWHPGPGDAAYHDWTVLLAGENSLDEQRVVACGKEGPGTAGHFLAWGTTQRILVQLTIPAAQPADTYVSTLYLDVVDNTI